MLSDFLNGAVGRNTFDRLEGYQVIARFNQEKDRKLIRATAKHRNQRSIFEGNVECILEYQIISKKRNL